ncbi:hypothetical protein BGZ94_005345, partial [Podila epigama]
MKDGLEFPRQPDRTYLEISPVYAHDPADLLQEGRVNNHARVAAASGQQMGMDGGSATNNKEGMQKFGLGWGSQWHVGKKDDKKTEDNNEETAQEPDQADTANDSNVNNNNNNNNSKDNEDEDKEERWLWMTNVWFSDGECGSGHLRQYRRRLSDVLAADNSTKWELMYIHKLPGPITHSSLSRKVIQSGEHVHTSNNHGKGDHQRRPRRTRPVESVRLAVIYKVIQDEHVAYHNRVYHMGVFQDHEDIQEHCGPTSSETCHRHRPFVHFDYVLPGTTPIKDFTLEHNTILYS